jgi:hypothetical protein
MVDLIQRLSLLLPYLVVIVLPFETSRARGTRAVAEVVERVKLPSQSTSPLSIAWIRSPATRNASVVCSTSLAGSGNAGTTAAEAVEVVRTLSRDEARNLLDNEILRNVDKGRRLQLQDQDSDYPAIVAGTVIAGNDPRLFETYGEFPLSSLDVLLDRAIELWAKSNDYSDTTMMEAPSPNLSTTITTRALTKPKKCFTVVDLGSGCGRLALYMALTRGGDSGSGGSSSSSSSSSAGSEWHVHGIEIAPSFHQEGLRAVQQAVDLGYLRSSSPLKDEMSATSTSFSVEDDASTIAASPSTSLQSPLSSRLSLHLGPAADFAELLQSADIVFCYSTAFESSHFSESAAALILAREWSDLLRRNCKQKPCICITTDKALDPRLGWKILDRINVPNPEVFESTGYIQGLEPTLSTL